MAENIKVYLKQELFKQFSICHQHLQKNHKKKSKIKSNKEYNLTQRPQKYIRFEDLAALFFEGLGMLD